MVCPIIALAAIGIMIWGGLLFHPEAGAQAIETALPFSSPDWPHSESDLAPDPGILYGSLPNGFRYVMMRNHEPKDRVSMHLVLQAGSYHEAENQRGVAHFLEHMMFNGTDHFPPGELVKYFQLIGMQFGPDANAHTGFAETVYDVLLPGNDIGSMENGMLVLKDYAQGALLLQEEIERERGVILAERRSRDSAAYRTFVAALQFEYPDARFSHRLPIGEEAVIRSVDRDLMKRFYDTWYRPDKLFLVMVGEFDVSMAGRLIAKTFGDMSGRRPGEPEPDFGDVSHLGTKAFHHYEPEMGTATVAIEVTRKVEKKADSRQFRQEDLMLDMAERMVQNRLEEMLSRPDVPFTSAAIQAGRFMEQIEYAEISAECSPERWEDALARIEQTLRKALLYGFTENELLRVKKEFISSFDSAVAQASTRESSDLAGQVIWHMNNNRVFLSPEQEKALFAPMVSRLSLEEARSALQKAWAPDHRLILVTGNASVAGDGGVSPEKRILSVFERSRLAAVERPDDGDPVRFPYLSKPASGGKILRKVEIDDLGIVQVDFENGVRLNLKKTDFEAGNVQVAISFGKGRLSEPPDKPGLAMISEELINESGLGRLDKNALAYALAGTQVDTRLEIEEDRFIFRGKCASPEVELLMQTLYAHLLDPGFRPDAFRLVMERLEQVYQTLLRDIDGGVKLQGWNFLAGGHSHFGMPSLEKLKTRTLADVQEWVSTALDKSDLEVNVVGDVDVAAVVDVVAGYFGALPGREEPVHETPNVLPSFPAGETLEIRVETQIPKGLVVVAYPTEDYWDISRTRRISVLADIFSEKLREKIREQLGISYSPFAYNTPSRAYAGYGTLQALVYVNPRDSALTIRSIRDIAEGVAQNGIDSQELARSLKPILTSIKDTRRTNSYWLDRVLTGSVRYPRQLDWSRSFETDYASITVEELQRMAKTYLDNSKAACITIVPGRQE